MRRADTNRSAASGPPFISTVTEPPKPRICRRAHLRWAWDSERFIYNPDFQVFMDSIFNRSR